MADEPDYSELLSNLKPHSYETMPKLDPTIRDLELASKIAERYRLIEKGKATIVSYESGEVVIGLELDLLFARDLIDIYYLYKAGYLIRNLKNEVTKNVAE